MPVNSSSSPSKMKFQFKCGSAACWVQFDHFVVFVYFVFAADGFAVAIAVRDEPLKVGVAVLSALNSSCDCPNDIAFVVYAVEHEGFNFHSPTRLLATVGLSLSFSQLVNTGDKAKANNTTIGLIFENAKFMV